MEDKQMADLIKAIDRLTKAVKGVEAELETARDERRAQAIAAMAWEGMDDIPSSQLLRNVARSIGMAGGE